MERYETLRRYVLEGRQQLPNPPLGLALWMARGMAGWMRQWTEWLGSATTPVWVRPPRGGGQPGPWQQPLTVLLAQMTLPHLEPRTTL